MGSERENLSRAPCGRAAGLRIVTDQSGGIAPQSPRIEANDFSGSAAKRAQERSCEDRTHYRSILSQESENLLNCAI
jgi:hypothetical protein